MRVDLHEGWTPARLMPVTGAAGFFRNNIECDERSPRRITAGRASKEAVYLTFVLNECLVQRCIHHVLFMFPALRDDEQGKSKFKPRTRILSLLSAVIRADHAETVMCNGPVRQTYPRS
jgi:hypothetical protein